MYKLTAFVEAGGLMSYSFSFAQQYRAAAGFVRQGHQGSEPRGVARRAADALELAATLRPARAQGISIPAAVLLRADRVIGLGLIASVAPAVQAHSRRRDQVCEAAMPQSRDTAPLLAIRPARQPGESPAISVWHLDCSHAVR